jgi:hypothetical protein
MTASRDRARPAETTKHNGHHPARRVPEPRKPQDIPAAEPKVPPQPSGRFGRAAGALRFAGRLAMGPPQAMMQLTPGASLEMLRIALGKSHVEPGKGDHRFADQAWQQNPAFRRAMQAYLYLGASADDVVDSLGVDGMAAERVRFALMLVREAMAPTNNFWTNPAAVKRCSDTGGRSVWRGAVNLTRCATTACRRWSTAGRSSWARTSRSRPARSSTGPRSSS